MIIRLLIILGCVVVFINGCNSLISQHFGTHKLRGYTMEEVQQTGIGDADFIEVSGALLSGDFVFKAAKSPTNPGVIIYPVLSDGQLAAHRRAHRVDPAQEAVAFAGEEGARAAQAHGHVGAQVVALQGGQIGVQVVHQGPQLARRDEPEAGHRAAQPAGGAGRVALHRAGLGVQREQGVRLHLALLSQQRLGGG